jgi:hypothetical protein
VTAAPTATVTITSSPVVSTTPSADLLCGAPVNPFDLHYCSQGVQVPDPPEGVCGYFPCIDNFNQGRGYMVVCNDGMVSMSGGIQGACSSHTGVRADVHRGR